LTDSVIPVILVIAVACLTAGSMLALSAVLGRPKKSRLDPTPYECGSRPFESVAKHRFSVKFYLVAMLFILFDIEAAFLIPWAVTFQGFASAKMFVLVEMAIFLGILVVGYLYIWWRGALEWE
jgi:NADH-quinone oxidoreductase subunit A